MKRAPLRAAATAAVGFLFFWFLVVDPPVATVGTEPPRGLVPQEAHELYRRSRVLLEEKQDDKALEATVRLHEAFPDNHIYLAQLARIHHRMGRYRDEAAAWEQFLLVAPTPVEACPAINQAYEKVGMAKESLDASERCLALDPSNPDSLFFLGKAYEREGRLTEARDLYARGASLAPGYADLAIGLARAKLRLGRLQDAKGDFQRIVRRWPDNTDALLLGGMILRAAGDLGAARRYLEKGAAKSRNDPDFYVILGGIAEQQDRKSEAIRLYGRALELDPGNRSLGARRRRLLDAVEGE
ncbi:MAG: hypothetical protein DMF49_11480 [Acidobacteria bacterium]|nr:MAG: hypothetical protein DMF49_11480 [Acidobacteriota bacterium]